MENKNTSDKEIIEQDNFDDSLSVSAKETLNNVESNITADISENLTQSVEDNAIETNNDYDNNLNLKQEEILQENNCALSDITPNIEQKQDELSQINTQNKNCKLDNKLDNRLKNLQFICIPFILAAIIISLFNMGKVRHPLSFLLLALGLAVLAIAFFARSVVINKHCSCKNCQHQSKSCIKYAILFGVAAIGLLGTFIYYVVI